jgi:rSAM/selenodomain-associated transferase 1
VDKVVERVDKSAGDINLPVGVPGRVGVFVKEPRPGAVKTRLSPPLSKTEAAAFYRAALEETVERLMTGPWQTWLFYAGEEDFFARSFPDLPRHPQRGDDLGKRMAGALELLQADGGPALLVGSDSPDLPLSLVAEALRMLQTADAVAAPAADGGYVLVGARKPAPQLFADIPWSTPEVLAASRRRAAQLGLDWRELPGWEDVDDWDALCRLLERSPWCATAGHVRRDLAHRIRHHVPG